MGLEDPISDAEVHACQSSWARAVVAIGDACRRGDDFVGVAIQATHDLYAYGHHVVLFKPTKASTCPFRSTADSAISYFVGVEAVGGCHEEDRGFALNGGAGWQRVTFRNHGIELIGTVAVAMGIYEFTCAATGGVTTVEYTFGYRRCRDGAIRIFLHHSSLPFSGGRPLA